MKTFAEWKEMGAKKAAVHLCKILGLSKDRERKLALILRTDWMGKNKHSDWKP